MNIIETYKELLHGNNKSEAGVKLGKAFSNEVNSFCCPTEDIAKKLYADKELHDSFAKLSAFWLCALKAMGELGAYMVDGRNEYSVKTGTDLMEKKSVIDYVSKWLKEDEKNLLLKEINLGHLWKKENVSMEHEACAYMVRDHRTLQQTFTKIIFCFIKLEIPELDNTMDSRWEKCPFI